MRHLYTFAIKVWCVSANPGAFSPRNCLRRSQKRLNGLPWELICSVPTPNPPPTWTDPGTKLVRQRNRDVSPAVSPTQAKPNHVGNVQTRGVAQTESTSPEPDCPDVNSRLMPRKVKKKKKREESKLNKDNTNSLYRVINPHSTSIPGIWSSLKRTFQHNGKIHNTNKTCIHLSTTQIQVSVCWLSLELRVKRKKKKESIPNRNQYRVCASFQRRVHSVHSKLPKAYTHLCVSGSTPSSWWETLEPKANITYHAAP